MFMFWLGLFLTFFLAYSLGTVAGHVFIRLVLKERPQQILTGERPSSAPLNQAEELGDGKAVVLEEPTEDEYKQHENEQKEQWGIVKALKNTLNAFRK